MEILRDLVALVVVISMAMVCFAGFAYVAQYANLGV